jgi:hypothetical protein
MNCARKEGILIPGRGHSITLFPSFLNRQGWKTAFVFVSKAIRKLLTLHKSDKT